MKRNTYINQETLEKLDLCHRWYSIVQAYSAQLVQYNLSKFNHSSGIILDPFVGTGTTCIECMLRRSPSIGIDTNPMAVFASRVKTTWDLNIKELKQTKGNLLFKIKKRLKTSMNYSKVSYDDNRFQETIGSDRDQIHPILSNENINPQLWKKFQKEKKNRSQKLRCSQENEPNLKAAMIS